MRRRPFLTLLWEGFKANYHIGRKPWSIEDELDRMNADLEAVSGLSDYQKGEPPWRPHAVSVPIVRNEEELRYRQAADALKAAYFEKRRGELHEGLCVVIPVEADHDIISA